MGDLEDPRSPTPRGGTAGDAGVGEAHTAIAMKMFTYAPVRFDGGLWTRPRVPAGDTPDRIRIVTWNVWFDDHQREERGAGLLAELGRRRPHVIALQEVTYPLLATILREPWVRADYQVSDVDVIGYDVIVLSRLPITRMMTLPLVSTMGRRLVVARLGCGLDVATVHLESTSACATERATQLGAIQPALAEASEDAVLVGDMNFDPAAALESAALDPSFVDVWPALRPDEPGYSVDGERNAMSVHAPREARRARIDRVFARSRRWRPEAIELVGTAPIDRAGTFVSDHFGLEVTLRDHRSSRVP
jgi:tyrosyl-DNA phosphodiesterase 2